tara:strand:- start:4548 stop:5000 length:453 start_codon:yes stop_codon:yes gene_type:complete
LVNIKINKTDLKKLENKLEDLRRISEKELSKEVGHTVALSSRRMKQNVVVDLGTLKQSIVFGRTGGKFDSQGFVKAKAKYAPYVEFGTGRLVNLKDMQELGIPDSYAAQFKGRGIKEVNLPARPFFFSSVRIEFKKMLDRVNDKLKRLTR